MNLSLESLEKLSQVVCGDMNFTPYITGSKLIDLFNKFGFNDNYEGGLPEGKSRANYTLMRLQDLNGTKKLGGVITDIISKRHFIGTNFDNNLDESIDNATTKINVIIDYDGYYFEKVNDNYVLKGSDINNAPISVDAHFDDIRNQIIEQIRQAKYTIWVAVAWLTDETLFAELKKKKIEGVNVQLVVADLDANNKLPLEQFFLTAKVKKGTCYGRKIEEIDGVNAYEDLMHNKFCIIDLKTVIHGSYNFTTKAEYNDESIMIVDNNREIVEKFADKFIYLKGTITEKSSIKAFY